MVSLYCAVVDVAGSAFPVDIDENKSVGHLKEAIKEKRMYQFPANDLQLFLAKMTDGAWLTKNDVMGGVSDTSGLTELRVARAKLRAVGLSAAQLGELRTRKRQLEMALSTCWWWFRDKGTRLQLSPKMVLAHCSDPFFSHFPTVEEGNEWLRFPSLLPLTKRQDLYIRASYRVIAEKALENPDKSMVKYAVITGTPGIGKSVFIYYMMWRLTKDQKRVLLFDSDGLFYFDGSTMFNCLSLPNKFNEQFWSPDLWCLVDSLDPTSIAELPYRRCSVLLASTPRRDCIGEFKKLVPTLDVFYKPLWTEEELARIAPLYPDAAPVWQNRMTCLGGVPRLVLQKDIQTDPQTILESACRSCSLDDCIKLVSINSEINSKTKVARTLIHIRSEEPYRTYSVGYASELAMKIVARTK